MKLTGKEIQELLLKASIAYEKIPVDYSLENEFSDLVYEFLKDIDPDNMILHSHYILNLYHNKKGSLEKEIVLHNLIISNLSDIDPIEVDELVFNHLEAMCNKIMAIYIVKFL